jgi:replicative DNA helicase
VSVPPQNIEAEENILGAILLAASYGCHAGHRLIDRVVATGLEPVDFYLASHCRLFGALIELRGRELPLDPLSVTDALDRRGAPADTRGRLERLAYVVPAFSNVEHYARIVARLARERRERWLR